MKKKSNVRSSAKRIRASAQNKANYSSLEDRRLLATTATLSGGGALTITGDATANEVLLSPNYFTSKYEVRLDYGGADTLIGEYDFGTINEVFFYGGAGDDIMNNSTDFPMTGFGHAGNDVFFGGGGSEIINGGSGDDTLYGSGGSDTLRGNDGKDGIFGGSENDTIFGGNDKDSIFGGEGDDFINGERGDDVVFAGGGNDTVLGFAGDDALYGGDGDDLLYGQAGDDRIYGGDGVDRLRGNPGEDQLEGQGGNDFVMGDQDNDEMDGGDGDDLMLAFDGDDVLNGGNGNDRMYGQNGNDEINGDAGNDIIRGGFDDDILRGGDGNDLVLGDVGNDRLFGEAGIDTLRGGDGIDGLVGGSTGDADRLYGDGGSDRFLTDLADTIFDELADDVNLNFVNDTANWNDAELELFDDVVDVIHHRSGSVALLRDSVSADDLTFTKVASLPGTTFGANTLTTDGTSFSRTIEFKEFDETGLFDKSDFKTSVNTQLGRNWDTAEEIDFAAGGNQFDAFMELSVWQDYDGGFGFNQSGDGQWWYDVFVGKFTFASEDSDPRDNPNEDFASSFAYYFDRLESDSAPSSSLQSKYDWLDNWMTTLG